MPSSSALGTAPSAAAPWWRFGHVWLIIVGPVIVIIAGFVTLWLAISRPHPGRGPAALNPPGRAVCLHGLTRRQTNVDATRDVDCLAGFFDGRCDGNAGFCDGGSARPALVWAAVGIVTAGRVHAGLFCVLDDHDGIQRVDHAAGHVTV